MKKEKGFTLIELLAVIVILAIIAIIATPLTINVINSAKEKSFINSAYGLIDGVRLLSTEQLINDGPSEVVVQFQDGETDNTNFKVSGDMPNSGTLHLNSDGKVELKVWSEELGKCAEKSATESEVKLTETTKENCKLEVKEDTTTGQTVTEVMESATGETAYDGTADNNLRYVGKTPNNYVKFNGDELWRIIGVFHDEEKGDQIKIIRDQPYNNTIITWDSNGSNNWATASLNLLWNDEENENSYINTIEKNDYASYSYIDLEHVWNIGGTPYYKSLTRSDFYTAERSNTPAGAEGSEATWTGAIGLMYPSDYGYASNGSSETCEGKEMYNWNTGDYETECSKNSWLYDSNNEQWTLTPHRSGSTHVMGVYDAGSVLSYSVKGYIAARPVLFLKSDTKIVGGQGTSDIPFILGA